MKFFCSSSQLASIPDLRIRAGESYSSANSIILSPSPTTTKKPLRDYKFSWTTTISHPVRSKEKWASFFAKRSFGTKHARAMPKTGAVDQWMLDQVPVTYTTYYTIREEDLKLVGDVPSSGVPSRRN